MISQQRLMRLRCEDVCRRIQSELDLLQAALWELDNCDDSSLRELGTARWNLQCDNYRNVNEWIEDILDTVKLRQKECQKRQERVWKIQTQWETYLDRLEWEKEQAI